MCAPYIRGEGGETEQELVSEALVLRTVRQRDVERVPQAVGSANAPRVREHSTAHPVGWPPVVADVTVIGAPPVAAAELTANVVALAAVTELTDEVVALVDAVTAADVEADVAADAAATVAAEEAAEVAEAAWVAWPPKGLLIVAEAVVAATEVVEAATLVVVASFDVDADMVPCVWVLAVNVRSVSRTVETESEAVLRVAVVTAAVAVLSVEADAALPVGKWD